MVTKNSDDDARLDAAAAADNGSESPPKKKKKKKKKATEDGKDALDTADNGDLPVKKKKKKKKTKPEDGTDGPDDPNAQPTPKKKKKKKKKATTAETEGTGPAGPRRPPPPPPHGQHRPPPPFRNRPPPPQHRNRPPPLPPHVHLHNNKRQSTGTLSTARSVSSASQRRPMPRGGNRATNHPPDVPKPRNIRPPARNNRNSLPETAPDNKIPRHSERSESSQQWNPPSRLLILIWSVVGAELVMDLVTTIISFKNFLSDGLCCGELIDMGNLPMGFTIPFFAIVLVELALLVHSVRLSLYIRRRGTQLSKQGFVLDPDHPNSTQEDKFLVLPDMDNQTGSIWLSFINVLVLINPFFGSVIAWMLLYQSSEAECFAVLGLEAASLILHWISVYLEGRKLSWCSYALHAVPILPFFITVICVLVYLQEGGVCYLVQESLFWYEGCQVCANGELPTDIDGREACADGSVATQQDYCGSDKQFCFFAY